MKTSRVPIDIFSRWPPFPRWPPMTLLTARILELVEGYCGF